jgi:hypothetical protein
MRFKFLLGVLVLLMILTALSTVLAAPYTPPEQISATRGAVQGNLQATREAAGANLQTTRDVVATQIAPTRESAAENLSGTQQAVQGNLEGTASAIQANVQATSAAVQTNIPATASALATRGAQEADAIRATVTAVYQQLPETIQSLIGEDLEAWLNAISQYGSFEIDPDNQIMRVTYNLTETLVNTLLDEALVASGYSVDAVVVDFIPDGAFVTVENITLANGVSGRLEMLFSFAAVNGQAEVTLVYATINDITLPDSVITELQNEFAEVIAGALTAGYDYDYSVDALYTTDSSLVMAATVPFQNPGIVNP